MILKAIKKKRDAVLSKRIEILLTDGRARPVARPNNHELVVILPSNGFRFVDVDHVVSVGRDSIRAKAH